MRRVLWLSLALWGCAGSKKPPPAPPSPVESRPAPPAAEETGKDDERPVAETPRPRRRTTKPAATATATATATQPSAATQPSYNPHYQSGIPSCDDYTRMMAVCVESPKFPETARQQMRDALGQMQQAWGQVQTSGPEARRAMSDACVQAIQAMSAAADQMCPGVFPPPAPPRP